MKKGDVSIAFLITVVFAVLGFAILTLFILNSLDDTGQENRDICKLSVITRATVPDASQQSIPLQCVPEKYCLSVSGDKEDCPQFAGESNVQVVKLSSNQDEQVKAIVQQAAESMYSCWVTMGEGKLDIFGTALTELQLDASGNTCVLCARVGLGKSVPAEVDARIGPALDQYLVTETVPTKGITYIAAFTDRQFQAYPRVTLEDLETEGELQVSGTDRQLAFVFSQIKVPSAEEVIRNLGYAAGTATGGSFLLPSVAKVGALIVTAGGTVAAAVTAYDNFYESVDAVAGYCGDFTSTASDGTSGCSMVQAIPYSVQNLKTLCSGGIQGNL